MSNLELESTLGHYYSWRNNPQPGSKLWVALLLGECTNSKSTASLCEVTANRLIQTDIRRTLWGHEEAHGAWSWISRIVGGRFRGRRRSVKTCACLGACLPSRRRPPITSFCLDTRLCVCATLSVLTPLVSLLVEAFCGVSEAVIWFCMCYEVDRCSWRGFGGICSD